MDLATDAQHRSAQIKSVVPFLLSTHYSAPPEIALTEKDGHSFGVPRHIGGMPIGAHSEVDHNPVLVPEAQILVPLLESRHLFTDADALDEHFNGPT
jgi:hypothetical protein